LGRVTTGCITDPAFYVEWRSSIANSGLSVDLC